VLETVGLHLSAQLWATWKVGYTKFSIPLSRRISVTSYLFSLLMVTTHALHLTSLWSNHHHHSKSLIAPSDMLHLIFGTSFLHHSAQRGGIWTKFYWHCIKNC